MTSEFPPVGQLLHDAARAHPDRIAVRCPVADGFVDVTYAELERRAAVGAALLSQRRGPVAVLSPNSIGWIESLFAIALSGRPLVPINPALGDREIRQLLLDCEAVLLLTGGEYRGRDLRAVGERMRATVETLREVHDVDRWIPVRGVGGALPDVDSESPFLVQYTSGTTGRPKGAVLSHRACVASATTMTAALEPSDHEVWASPMPLHHVGASVAHAVAMASVAGTYVMLTAFDPTVLVRAAAESGATLIAGVPTVYLGILENPALRVIPVPALRVLMLGGASIAPSLVARIEKHFGARVAVLYGQSESPAVCQTSLADDSVIKAETIGRALPLRRVRVVKPGSDREIAVGEIGELCVSGPTVMDGYLGRPDATAEVLSADGWLRTGDLCSIDALGLIRFHGRLRDVILRGGENVYAREVEDAINALPGVSQVAVVGVPDDRWGEVVGAVVEPQPGVALDVDDLAAGLEASLARFKRPARWAVVETMPMTASGKIQKFRLVDEVKWLSRPTR